MFSLTVTNGELMVGEIKMTAATNSSLVLIGDASGIQLASFFDTPKESFINGPFLPLPLEGGREG
ncbi:spore gernimation protein GerPD [Caldibacillus debilis]|uniref:spore gernimation protein GerPD n=1 Tax=Caldibacillus debilis TaxID=301148 RepID=UPI0023EFD0B8|nr:spore gernimation protein GerPD [Caldibacillus debilis]